MPETVLVSLMSALLLCGCGKSDVAFYEVPAEKHEVADALGEVREYPARGEERE